MFNGLNKYSLSGSQVLSREVATVNAGGAAVGRGLGGREIASTAHREVANAGGGNTSSSAMVLGGITAEDITLNYIGGASSNNKAGGGSQSQVPQEIYKYYDAIFREDSICGAVIELRSSIPYGDFSLHGVGKARLQKYEEAVDNMRLRTMMPRLALERDTQGAFFGLLDWNASSKTYDSMLPYSRMFVQKILYPSVFGMDPVVDIELNAFLADIVNNDDPRLTDIKKNIPNFILQAGKGGTRGIPVPMDSVVWIDRPHSDPRFNSMLHRILPVFLIERALTRGTIEAAHRRQRGIFHITAGMGDQWLATPEEMTGIAHLFNNADADPMGAIVVTREGINTNEVRNPTDFWRITDSYEQTVGFKLRAMGASESFLSGDATFNNQEVAISTFLQTIKTERNQVTDQLMYRKVFPQIAEANNYKHGGREKSSLNDEERARHLAVSQEVAFLVSHGKREQARAVADKWKRELAANAANSIQNIAMYDMPKVTWKQSLMPEGDAAYIEMLNLLAERNVPPPIRALFAAGGLDFDAIMESKKQDLEDRKKLTEYIEEIRANSPGIDPNSPEGQALNQGGEFASTTREVGVLERDYGDPDRNEYYTEMGGKITRPMTLQGKTMLRDKQHKELAHALSRIAETHNAKVRANVDD